MKYINPYKSFTGAFIPTWLLRSDIVSGGAKLVYARLCQFAGESGVAFPSREVLAEECGCPLRTVARYLDELKDAKLIEVERLGLQRSNRYRFLHHEIMSLVAHPDVHILAHQEVPDLAHQDVHDLAHPIRRESREENQDKYSSVKSGGSDVPPTPKEPRFRKPTPSEVDQYSREIGASVRGTRFCDYYEACGWKIGKTPMKNWKAAVRNWKQRELERNPPKPVHEEVPVQ